MFFPFKIYEKDRIFNYPFNYLPTRKKLYMAGIYTGLYLPTVNADSISLLSMPLLP